MVQQLGGFLEITEIVEEEEIVGSKIGFFRHFIDFNKELALLYHVWHLATLKQRSGDA